MSVNLFSLRTKVFSPKPKGSWEAGALLRTKPFFGTGPKVKSNDGQQEDDASGIATLYMRRQHHGLAQLARKLGTSLRTAMQPHPCTHRSKSGNNMK